MADARKLKLLEIFKNPAVVDAYRKWAVDPNTAKFLSLAADLVSPSPSTETERSMHSEAVSKLVRRETAEEFMMACLNLEDYAEVYGAGGLPEPTYGATAPAPTTQAKPRPRRRSSGGEKDQYHAPEPTQEK